jgi:hypothetical protein
MAACPRVPSRRRQAPQILQLWPPTNQPTASQRRGHNCEVGAGLRDLRPTAFCPPLMDRLVVGGVFVVGVAGGFELERGMFHVEVAGQAGLQGVEELGGVAVVEAGGVHHDVGGQHR